MSGRRRNGKVGIALAGGGPLGGIYEIGALVALEEALSGLDLADLDLYVGVSSGAFVAAGLANGVTPARDARDVHSRPVASRSVRAGAAAPPGGRRVLHRLMMFPQLMQSAFFGYLGAPPVRGFIESFARLTRGLPNGIFDNGAIAAYLARLFSKPAAPTTSAS